jgi:formylglycine-generating enzyme required for sulfatase activity
LLRQRALSPELVTIPASEAILGASFYTSERPDTLQEDMYLVGEFQIEPYEVTNERYLLCVEAKICSTPLDIPRNYTGDQNAQKPVTNVTALQANQFCAWLGRTLPTELQWERAARFTDGRNWPWGMSTPSAASTNLFFGELSTPQPVGHYKADQTPEGVYDLGGNIMEWTLSSYYKPQQTVDLSRYEESDALKGALA